MTKYQELIAKARKEAMEYFQNNGGIITESDLGYKVLNGFRGSGATTLILTEMLYQHSILNVDGRKFAYIGLYGDPARSIYNILTKIGQESDDEQIKKDLTNGGNISLFVRETFIFTGDLGNRDLKMNKLCWFYVDELTRISEKGYHNVLNNLDTLRRNKQLKMIKY